MLPQVDCRCLSCGCYAYHARRRMIKGSTCGSALQNFMQDYSKPGHKGCGKTHCAVDKWLRSCRYKAWCGEAAGRLLRSKRLQNKGTKERGGCSFSWTFGQALDRTLHRTAYLIALMLVSVTFEFDLIHIVASKPSGRMCGEAGGTDGPATPDARPPAFPFVPGKGRVLCGEGGTTALAVCLIVDSAPPRPASGALFCSGPGVCRRGARQRLRKGTAASRRRHPGREGTRDRARGRRGSPWSRPGKARPPCLVRVARPVGPRGTRPWRSGGGGRCGLISGIRPPPPPHPARPRMRTSSPGPRKAGGGGTRRVVCV